MEILKQMQETIRKECFESEHVEFDWKASELVGRLTDRYHEHRERIGAYTAPNHVRRDGVGGSPEPSEVTPLMKG